MPRVRLQFSKGDAVRFLSHLDLMKAFQRAIRRAGIPIAYSEGFNPHPKMNFASALAVGVTSEKEYVDIELKSEMEVDEIIERLNSVLPIGFKITSGKIVSDRAPSLMTVVKIAEYIVSAPLREEVTTEKLLEQMEEFLKSREIIIKKWNKKGYKEKNIRQGIISFKGEVKGVPEVYGRNRAEFLIRTQMSNEGNVRPEEVIKAFAENTKFPIQTDELYIKRTGLFIEQDGKMASPMGN